jgi:hypothetical protein
MRICSMLFSRNLGSDVLSKWLKGRYNISYIIVPDSSLIKFLYGEQLKFLLDIDRVADCIFYSYHVAVYRLKG